LRTASTSEDPFFIITSATQVLISTISLKGKYREINAELGKTGAGLTAEQIRENPDLKGMLGMFVLEHPLNAH
jgi:hypothetical protein